MNIPELYIYDQRYTVLLIAEISVREKGHFISNDLKQETNLSDKSVERFINFLVKKGFYISKTGRDKRRKLYYPSKNLHKHIMSTWSVRVKQNQAVKDFGLENINEILDFFKNTKEYPFPNNKAILAIHLFILSSTSYLTTLYISVILISILKTKGESCF